MANRFLDTNYYKSPFVKSLPPEMKSFYSFVICDCTASGIWFLDFEAVRLYTGFDLTFEDFELNFIKKRKAIKISQGKYFFPDFIEHQYPGGLSDNNKAHKNILIELRKFNLLDINNFPKKEAPLEESLCDPLQGVQGIGNGNGQGNGQGQGNTEPEENLLNGQTQFIVPEMQKIWDKHNPAYPKNTQKDFTALREIGDFILSQEKVKTDERDKIAKVTEAFEIISKYISTDNFFKNYSLKQVSTHIQSIVSNIRNGKSKSKQATGGQVDTKSAFDKIDSFYDKIGKR